MVTNPKVPAKNGYLVKRNWLTGEDEYVKKLKEEVVTGSYTATGLVPKIVLPFKPIRLLIHGQKLAAVLYWEEGMVQGVMWGTDVSYAYLGGASVTLTTSGKNTEVTISDGYSLRFQASHDPYASNSPRPLLGASTCKYGYKAWGVIE